MKGRGDKRTEDIDGQWPLVRRYRKVVVQARMVAEAIAPDSGAGPERQPWSCTVVYSLLLFWDILSFSHSGWELA